MKELMLLVMLLFIINWLIGIYVVNKYSPYAYMLEGDRLLIAMKGIFLKINKNKSI